MPYIHRCLSIPVLEWLQIFTTNKQFYFKEMLRNTTQVCIQRQWINPHIETDACQKRILPWAPIY